MIDPGMIDKELMEYFRELSPVERKRMFERIEGLDPEVEEFCRNLYRDRHTDPKDPEHSVDNWLWKIVYLPGLRTKSALMKSAVKNEAQGTIMDLHLEDPGQYSDMEKTLLYLEFRNAAKRYLSTCNGTKYGSTLFGMKHASEEEKKAKAAEDIWKASKGIARAAGEEDRLEIWCLALRDELYQYNQACKHYYEDMENKK